MFLDIQIRTASRRLSVKFTAYSCTKIHCRLIVACLQPYSGSYLSVFSLLFFWGKLLGHQWNSKFWRQFIWIDRVALSYPSECFCITCCKYYLTVSYKIIVTTYEESNFVLVSYYKKLLYHNLIRRVFTPVVKMVLFKNKNGILICILCWQNKKYCN